MSWAAHPALAVGSLSLRRGALRLTHQLIRQSRRLGHEAAATAGEGDLDRRGDAGQMARRDKERLAAGPGAHGRADDLLAVVERRVIAEVRSRLDVLPNQPALGTADRRRVQQQPEVRRRTKAARVRVAL